MPKKFYEAFQLLLGNYVALFLVGICIFKTIIDYDQDITAFPITLSAVGDTHIKQPNTRFITTH